MSKFQGKFFFFILISVFLVGYLASAAAAFEGIEVRVSEVSHDCNSITIHYDVGWKNWYTRDRFKIYVNNVQILSRTTGPWTDDYRVTGLETGRNYEIKVEARWYHPVKKNEWRSKSITANTAYGSDWPEMHDVYLAAARNAAITANLNQSLSNQVKINWNTSLTVATAYYHLYKVRFTRSLAIGGSYWTSGWIDPTAPHPYVFYGLEPGRPYDFTVEARWHWHDYTYIVEPAAARVTVTTPYHNVSLFNPHTTKDHIRPMDN